MWDEHRDLTPEERLDIIVEILTEGVLRLIEKKKTSSPKKIPETHASKNPIIPSKIRIKDVSETT